MRPVDCKTVMKNLDSNIDHNNIIRLRIVRAFDVDTSVNKEDYIDISDTLF